MLLIDGLTNGTEPVSIDPGTVRFWCAGPTELGGYRGQSGCDDGCIESLQQEWREETQHDLPAVDALALLLCYLLGCRQVGVVIWFARRRWSAACCQVEKTVCWRCSAVMPIVLGFEKHHVLPLVLANMCYFSRYLFGQEEENTMMRERAQRVAVLIHVEDQTRTG